MMLGINRMVNGSLLVWRKMKKGCGGKLILHVIILGATRKLIKNYNWLWLLLIVTRALLQTLLGGGGMEKKAKTLSRLQTGTILMYPERPTNKLKKKDLMRLMSTDMQTWLLAVVLVQQNITGNKQGSCWQNMPLMFTAQFNGWHREAIHKSAASCSHTAARFQLHSCIPVLKGLNCCSCITAFISFS